jgi:WXG100 family type VII secretion target
MAQSGFNVDTDMLGQKSQAVQALVPQIQQQLTQLNAQMQQLFSTWQGQSSTGFQRLHSQWHTSYVQLNQNLNTIGTNLAANNRNYIGADVASTPRA